jgi:hypothetical protein
MARRAILGLAAVALAALLTLGAAFAYLFGLGGLHPGYRARNGDVFLTRVARGALPVMDALDRYRAANGTFPHPSLAAEEAAIAAYLPSNVKIIRAGRWLVFEAGGLSPWIYSRAAADGSAYSLSIKLGWDPRLVYRHSRDGAQWIFEPGDGSDVQPIALRP